MNDLKFHISVTKSELMTYVSFRLNVDLFLEHILLVPAHNKNKRNEKAKVT